MSRRRSSAGLFFAALVATAAGAPTPSSADSFQALPVDVKTPQPRVTPVYVPSKPVTLFTDPFGEPTEHGREMLAKRARYTPKLTRQSCLPAAANASLIINTLLSTNGPGAIVPLCPRMTYDLNATLIFTDDSQQIITVGLPTDASRAVLRIVNPAMSVAIYGACDKCTNIAVRSVQVDGARPALGPLSGGAGLLEMGGNPANQTVANCKIYEPRGWTCLHFIEGWHNSCRGATITGNTIGPSGNSPNSDWQFRRRADVVTPGQWADGISNACAQSTIKSNTVIDATDGGIVQFGGPGTVIADNTIISSSRVAMGGINMVDYYPYLGDFTGVSVTGNTLRTDGAMIKIGIAMGPLTWSTGNATWYRNFGASVTRNVFQSSRGAFAYGIAGGMNASTVSGNSFGKAKFSAAQSQACSDDFTYPYPQAMVVDPYTTTGTYSGTTSPGPVGFMICMMPAAYGTPYVAPKSSAAPAPAATSTAPAAPMVPGKTRTVPGNVRIVSDKSRQVPPKRALEAITFNDTDSQPAAQRRRLELELADLGAWIESENMPIMAI